MSKQDKDQLKKKSISSKIVDLSYLNESLSSDREMISQMIQLFLVQSPEKIALLKKSVAEKDFSTIRETSHFLKSSFTIMGLYSKNELSKIEQLSTQKKDYTTIVKLTENVLINFEKSINEYTKILSAL